MADDQVDKPTSIFNNFTDIIGGQRDESYVNLSNDISKKIGVPANPANGDSLTYNASLGRWDRGRKGFYTPSEVGGAEWTIYSETRVGSFAAADVDLRVGGTGGAAQVVPVGAKAVICRALIFNYVAVGNDYTILSPAGNTIVSLRAATATGTAVYATPIVPLKASADGSLTSIRHSFTITGATCDIFVAGYGWLF